MAKELEHEIFSSPDKKSLGTIWLGDDGSVDSDDQMLLNILEHQNFRGVSFQDGEKFLQKISTVLRNGYMYAKKVK